MTSELPKIGERVYVVPYTTPGHEQPGYAGTVVEVHGPNERGHRYVTLSECTGGRGYHRLEWLHNISGYTQEAQNGPE